MTTKTVLVVGGGLGGLTAAHALLRQGFAVQVLERAGALNEVGAGITLWSNALAALRWAGVEEAVKAAGTLLGGGVMGLADGRILSRMDGAGLEKAGLRMEMLGIHRADLQRVLFETLPAGTLRLGAALREFRQDGAGVTAVLADGEEVRGDVLVGADGIHSVVRAQLRAEQGLGRETPRFAGYTCWRGICADWNGRAGVDGEFWGRGRRFGRVPIGRDRLYWFACENRGPGQMEAPEARQAAVAGLFADWAFDIPEMIARTPAAAILQNDIIDRPAQAGWRRRRVVLLGDAAHPTTPNMGQGAAMAMEDAVVLARCLALRTSPEQALIEYEQVRFARCKMITDTSWRLGGVAQWEGALATSLRNFLFSNIPESSRAKGLAAVASYDVGAADLIL